MDQPYPVLWRCQVCQHMLGIIESMVVCIPTPDGEGGIKYAMTVDDHLVVLIRRIDGNDSICDLPAVSMCKCGHINMIDKEGKPLPDYSRAPVPISGRVLAYKRQSGHSSP